ncbi:MAG: hypothetical protein ACYDHH_01330 [Solirubrobacteraceae bacterium]
MRFKAHRRPGDHGRLGSQLMRGRASAQHAGGTTGGRTAGGIETRQARRLAPTPNGRPAPRPAALPGRSPGRLVGVWTVNDAGRLVMVWSLVPDVPPGDVPWAAVRRLSTRAGARQP